MSERAKSQDTGFWNSTGTMICCHICGVNLEYGQYEWAVKAGEDMLNIGEVYSGKCPECGRIYAHLDTLSELERRILEKQFKHGYKAAK